MPRDSHAKSGYLHNDFELFYLKDMKNMKFEFHYHDFNKIIIFIAGCVTYFIEGKAYKLKPWDIVLINSNQLHKPIIDSSVSYERIIIWVNSAFLAKHNSVDCNLLNCFEIASHKNLSLVRLSPEKQTSIKGLLHLIRDADKNKDFGQQILKSALFLQFIVYINRAFLGPEKYQEQSDVEYDETISQVLNYINTNLTDDLSLDKLSTVFYLSKYYLMHKFREQTGYSIHNYILQKRLIVANSLIKAGHSVTSACLECGYGDYSNFVRAFKKMYGVSPKRHQKMHNYE